jgi:hypothetical protein
MKPVIEPSGFLADVRASGMSDEEHTAIVATLAADPDQGEIIRESGGARKVRMAGRGKGKSGGYRIAFYPAPPDVPVLMLAIINKGERANLSKAETRALRKELAGYVKDYRASVRQKVEDLRRRRRV